MQGEWDPRRTSLRHARLCGAGDRMGLRHDDGVGRLEASRRSGRGQRGEVPATDEPDRFDVRKGSLLMPHLLIAGKVHPAGLALLDRCGGFTYDYVEEVTE